MSGVVWYVMTLEERGRTIERLAIVRRRVAEYARQELYASWSLMRQQPVPFATLVLAALNIVMFVVMLSGTGAVSESATLVKWGGGFGPKTSNGEWWRLVTSAFTHGGFISLVVNTFAIMQVGAMVERGSGG